MKNSDNLYVTDPNNIDKRYSDAYLEGRTKERELAIEACRLRCSNLFGNRCMCRSMFGRLSKKICDGNCWYLDQYRLELYKLETNR